MERQWSNEQKAIFAWFKEPTAQRNLVVRARAGTGKTTTILEAINGAPERRILLAAFNKIIAEELQSRLRNPAAEAKTLHALGFSYLRAARPKVKVDNKDRKWTLAKAACPRSVPYSVLRLVAELHTKGRETVPHLVKAESSFAIDTLCEIALQSELTLTAEDAEHFDDRDVAAWAHAAMLAAAAQTDSIDFADMIFLPLVHGWVSPRYDLVVVDEAQDMSTPQLEIAQLACKKGGRVAVIGDDRQCQPPGTLVRLSNGREVPIERVRTGDCVVAWDRQGKALVGRRDPIYPVKVESRRYEGDMITVRAGSRSTRCTPEHLWAVKLADRSPAKWVTYLMRRGDDYRVGWCQLYTSKGGLHLGQRTRLDRADSAWILGVHATKAEATLNESLIATVFGLPLVQFSQSVASPSAGHITQKYLNAFWRRARMACHDLGGSTLRERAERCLESFGRRHAHPFYVAQTLKGYKRTGRTTVKIVAACNLFDGLCVPVPIGGSVRVKWTPIKLSREHYRGLVYSLEVRKHPYYVADGIVTHNCLYSWRGADANALDRMRAALNATELGLKTTYRCPQLVVERAQQIVPDFVAAPSAPQGVVRDCLDARDTLLREAGPSDFVLSRTNAPLVPLCLAMLKAGKVARIRGRDLSQGLRKLCEQLERAGARTIDALRIALHEHFERTADKLNRRLERGELRQDTVEDMIGRVRDSVDVILALSDELVSLAELYARFDTLFTGDDVSNVVMFSTVHRAKGLEADRVWLLESTFRAKRRADDSGDGWRSGIEEANIRYVAITRAKHELVWLRGEIE